MELDNKTLQAVDDWMSGIVWRDPENDASLHRSGGRGKYGITVYYLKVGDHYPNYRIRAWRVEDAIEQARGKIAKQKKRNAEQ